MVEFLKFEKSNCKNCYKCIRNCPVKAIRFSGNLASVIPEECILCGKCYVVCPQNAKKIVDETEIVNVLLHGDAPVIASVAPSFAAYFNGVGINALETALKKLGFASAEETALGATMVKTEYERLVNAGEQDIIITSCCHTVNLLVEKYYPRLVGYLAPVMTPMSAHHEDLKRRHPEAKTVFIGPCLSKKDETDKIGIEAALTFDELSSMFEAAGIEVGQESEDTDTGLARFFPTTGGILKTMTKKSPNYTYFTIDGIDNCVNALKDIESGKLHHCFIEMSACAGSCVGGPIMEKNRNTPVRHYQAISEYAGEKDFDIEQPSPSHIVAEYAPIITEKAEPTEEQITEILHKIGKFTAEDELNCGTCGYDSCREKAKAVFQGKAELNMCLPFLMDKSERFTNNILENSPNGIMVVNEFYEIQQINKAALKAMNIHSRSDVLGEPLVRVMNPADFLSVMEDGKKVNNKRDYYAEFGKYLELTISRDSVANQLIAILRDVTDEETAKKNKEKISRKTIETADQVVDKQMRIVQEIASLLGETAAETKIALTKLKESITDDNDE